MAIAITYSLTYFIFSICLFLLINVYVNICQRLLYKVDTLQTKKWMSDLTDNMILGINNRKLYSNINRDGKIISCWYLFWIFNTKNETIMVAIVLKNKFSKEVIFIVSSYNHETNKFLNDSSYSNFDNIQTSKKGNTITINLNNIYIQETNILNQTNVLHINTDNFKISLNLSIEEYKTNFPFFVPFVENTVGNIVNIKGTQTYSPNEWFSDNPLLGDIINGNINGNEINKGTYWFDNLIACNNGFLTPYSWFLINNEDWIINLVWIGDTDENKNNLLKPMMIKNKKQDKFFYCGVNDVFQDPLSPIKKMEFITQKKMGVNDFDDYTMTFQSSEIDIYIKSCKGTSNKIYGYSYYQSDDADKNFDTFSEWDKEYYKIIRNIKYIFFVIMADIEIRYDNKIEKFREKQFIDAMYREDKSIPRTIQYRE